MNKLDLDIKLGGPTWCEKCESYHPALPFCPTLRVRKALERRKKMGIKYEIRYFVLGTGDHHYDDADNLEDALRLMKECKKETKSKCISLIWRQ